MDEIQKVGLTLTFDFIKLITTLDTGFIVILATLIEKVFTGKIILKKLIMCCITSLGISLIGSLMFLGFFVTWTLYQKASLWPKILVSIGFWVSIIGFFLALLLFMLFVLKNFQHKYMDGTKKN